MNHIKTIKIISSLILLIFLSSCVSPPPRDINNVCNIFREYPQWYRHALDVERRWKVPVPVQMAIIHQESKFDAKATPPRKKLFSLIPWNRPSTAYGYAQALNPTWKDYKKGNGWVWSARHDFSDGVDFIGWYANQANIRAGIPRTDAYSLYLAYHEGIGGYQRKTYLKKPWLIAVSHKVKARSALYTMQLNSCRASLHRHSWF